MRFSSKKQAFFAFLILHLYTKSVDKMNQCFGERSHTWVLKPKTWSFNANRQNKGFLERWHDDLDCERPIIFV